MDWKHLLAYITGTVDQELLLRNEYLVTENRILRQQLRNGSKIIPLFTFTEALPSSSILGGPCQKRSACSF
jgi:hypothetical protein